MTYTRELSGLTATATALPPRSLPYAARHNWVPPGGWAPAPLLTPVLAQASAPEAGAAAVDAATAAPVLTAMASATTPNACLMPFLPS